MFALPFLNKRIKNKGKNSIVFKKNNCRKYSIKMVGENNTLKIEDNFKCKYLNIKIKGSDNIITIGKNIDANRLYIEIAGKKNNIVLGNNIQIVEELIIYNHCDTQNGSINIGDNTSFFKTAIHNYDNNSSIEIGEDCMFAYNTLIYNTDGHSIFQDGELINQARECKIGNHVWLGMDSSILKNSRIPNNCIVGKSAVVCRKFHKENTAIAGNPARIIKENVSWDRKSVNEFSKKPETLATVGEGDSCR